MKKLLTALFPLFFLVAPVLAHAQIVGTGGELKRQISKDLQGAAKEAFNVSAKDAAAGDALLSQIFVQWMNIAIGVLGLIAVVLFVYAGYLWLTAGGETGPIQKAKTIIKRVVVGMVVVGMAYGIITFALGAFIPTGQLEREGASTAKDKEAAETR